MELRLENGKYAPGEYQGLKRVDGLEEIKQRVCMKLCARRGSFLPMPEYGSRLHTLPTVKASRRENAARQFVTEALRGETDLELLDLALGDISGGNIQLTVTLRYKGRDTLVVETTI